MILAASPWWFLARSSGIVAGAFLVAAVVWGVLSSTRLLHGWAAPAWLLDLHRWLGTLTVVFTVVHLVSLWADTYVEFDLVSFLVPFASPWRPTAVGLGVLALYLLLAVQVTSSSWLRPRISRRAWRIVHLGSFLLVWLAAMHAGLSGSDTGHPLYRLGVLVAVGVLVFTITFRILAARERRPASPTTSAPA